MPVKLRLKVQGRSKAPHYAIVAADSRAPRDGRFIQKIGFYNPLTEPARVYVDHEAALKWLGNGAQPTNTVRALLRHAGVTVKYALIKQGKSEEEIEKIYGKWRSEKDAKKKKKVISVDISGNPLEPVPDVATKPAPKKEEPKPEPEAEAPVAEAAVEAEAPATEEAPVEEAPAAEEAPATEEAAPEAEEVPTAEAETPVEEEKSEG
ncbi:MAG: 30S ribosomal protein S16 [Bacteroidota bacterium]